jgi:hypothetical protein
MSTVQQLAQSFGVAVSAIGLTFFSYKFSTGPILSIQTFHDTFLILGLLTFFSGITFIFLKKEDGLELIM